MKILTKKNYTINKLIILLKFRNHIIHNKNSIILGSSPIQSSKKGDITFCIFDDLRGIKLISASKASLIICPSKLKSKLSKKKSSLVFVKNPRLSFLRIIKKITLNQNTPGIHSSAIVESQKIGKNVHIGPFTYVAKNVTIGNNVTIHGHVNINNNTTIGNNVIIQPSAVIGADGISPQRNEHGMLEKFIHLAGVILEDNVEIGSNTSIMRGSLENTIIGKGTVVAHLVNVGHQVCLGKNCFVTSQVTLGGKSTIGEETFVGIGAQIRDGIKIGKKVYIGMGSIVRDNVPSYTMVAGSPARKLKKIKK